ncbi:MAG: hypothetical protein GY861_13590 [bacterium]|nr:hypothetical protein [bacterium]
MKIQKNTINWLLEEDNPPVRYLTHVNILNKTQTDPDVQQAKARLMDYNVTQGILSHCSEFWNDEKGAYWKYTGKYWQLIFLSQFLADGNDPLVAQGVKNILESREWISRKDWHCLKANILTALIRLGYGNHPLVIEEVEVLANRIITEGGIKCSLMSYSLLSECYMALPKLLICFGEIPEEKRSSAVNSAIKLIVKTILEHQVYIYVPGTRKEWQKILEKQPKRTELPKGQTVKGWLADQRVQFLDSIGIGEREPKKGWLKFGFPHHYNSDILEAMYALARVHEPMTPELQKPLQVIKEKMTSDGKWKLDNTLNGKMWADVEEKNKPSKWITYFALYVLNRYNP